MVSRLLWEQDKQSSILWYPTGLVESLSTLVGVSNLNTCTHSEMDITTDYGSVIGGSNPSGCTRHPRDVKTRGLCMSGAVGEARVAVNHVFRVRGFESLDMH